MPATKDIVNCTRCGREIVVRDSSVTGFVSSEYVSDNGECFDCAKKKRGGRA